MIYFMQPTGGGPIKIGTTIQLGTRLKQLAKETGDDLTVLAVIDGGQTEERNLHRRFSHLRTFGEWFEPGDDLLGFIVAEGRPWEDDSDQYSTIKFDKLLAGKARLISQARGVSMAEYLSEMARGQIDRDYAKLLRELDAGTK